MLQADGVALKAKFISKYDMLNNLRSNGLDLPPIVSWDFKIEVLLNNLPKYKRDCNSK